MSIPVVRLEEPSRWIPIGVLIAVVIERVRSQQHRPQEEEPQLCDQREEPELCDQPEERELQELHEEREQLQ